MLTEINYERVARTLSAISSIELERTRIIGETIEEIAVEKAG